MHQSNLDPSHGPFSAQGSNFSLPTSTPTQLESSQLAFFQQQAPTSNPPFFQPSHHASSYSSMQSSVYRPQMAKHKRKSSNGDNASMGGEAQKKVKTGTGGDRPAQGQQVGKIDPTFGQRSALPGLDDEFAYEEPGVGEGHDYSDSGAGSGSEGMTEEDKVGREALMYLRAVRLEATSIPTLLVAPREPGSREIYDDGVGDFRGCYQDGAYIAAPLSTEEMDMDHDEDDTQGEQESSREPQLVYFESIIRRYTALHDQLATTPPRAAVSALEKHQVSYIRSKDTEWKAWRWRLRGTDPAPAQLASMDKSSVLRLLKLLCLEFGNQGGAKKLVSKTISRWAWGLLARLPDRGELTSEEIGVIRDFGKRAVWLIVKLKGAYDLSALDEQEDDGEVDEEEYEEPLDSSRVDDDLEYGDDGQADDSVVEGDSADHEKEKNTEVLESERANNVSAHFETGEPTTSADTVNEEDLEAARARLLANLPSTSEPSINIEPEISQPEETEEEEQQTDEELFANTKATIDMVLTIVGEVYGQRDLLEFREVWD